MNQDLQIIAENLHKSYRRGPTVTPVLRGASFEVRRGEIVFLAGPSGSGKSTLLSIVGCILAPDAGTMHIAGRNVTALTGSMQSQIRLEQIGFMFQRFHLIRGLSAAENAVVPLTLAGKSPATARKRAVELLQSVGLSDKIDADPRNRLVVVEHGVEVIGTLQLTLIPYLTYGGRARAQIEAVRVDARHRGEGVGRRLFDWAIAAAREAGCHMVQLTTDKRRPAALAFYRSLGFQASHEGMKLHLGV